MAKVYKRKTSLVRRGYNAIRKKLGLKQKWSKEHRQNISTGKCQAHANRKAANSNTALAANTNAPAAATGTKGRTGKLSAKHCKAISEGLIRFNKTGKTSEELGKHKGRKGGKRRKPSGRHHVRSKGRCGSKRK